MSSDRVSVGELRAMGFPVPDNIPDCATTLRSAINWQTIDAMSGLDGKPIQIGISVTYGAPFEWVRMSATATIKKQ